MCSENNEESDYNLDLDLLSMLSSSCVSYPRSGLIGKVNRYKTHIPYVS